MNLFPYLRGFGCECELKKAINQTMSRHSQTPYNRDSLIRVKTLLFITIITCYHLHTFKNMLCEKCNRMFSNNHFISNA